MNRKKMKALKKRVIAVLAAVIVLSGMVGGDFTRARQMQKRNMSL